MEAPDKIYINGFSAFATVPVNEGIEYIRKDLVEHIIRGALGPQDALNKIRSL